jgi:hypothetical protein
MKKLLLLFVFLSGFASAYAQTNVSGGIFSNTTWSLANSPYIMTGPVVVFPNVTLTIEPGVVVKIKEKSTNTSEQVYLELRGKLVAKGTSASPISFIPENTPTLGTDFIWQGIIIKSAQGGAIDMDYFSFNNSYYGISYDDVLLDTLVFNECKFSKNNYTLSINTNLVFNNCEFTNNSVAHTVLYVYGSITSNNCLYKDNYACMTFIPNGVNVNNCIFENNQSCFLQISGKFNRCTFKNNNIVFQENGTLAIDSSEFINNGTGIDAFGLGSVKNSLFTNNQLGLSVGANSVIENNTIVKNQVGLGLAGAFMSGMVLPFIKDNKICDNILYNLENKSDFNLGLENNCFCLNDSVAIDAKIYDGYDDFTRGLINFASYDSTCTTIKQKFIKIKLNTGITSTKKELAVFPNPLQDKLYINGLSENQNTWSVYDMLGKKVLELNTDENNVVLDLSDLTNGVYFLRSSNYLPVKIIKY